MTTNLRVFLATMAASILALYGAAVQAQTATDQNEGLRIVPGTQAGTYALSWWGRTGRTYFIQHNEDLTNPYGWVYVPVIESGTNQVIQWGGASNSTKSFFRLIYTDAATGGDASTADFDGDGVSNIDELNQGTDPFDYYNGQTPVLSKISGDNQSAAPQTLLPQPLVVQITSNGSTPLANALVSFAITTPGGVLYQSNSGLGGTSQAIRTDGQGRAQIYLELSDVPGQTCQVVVSAGSGSHTATQAFTATGTAGNPPAAPSNLVASALSASWIGLAWQDNSNNETGFRIERRAAAGGSFSVVKTVARNVTHTTDVSLPANTGFIYRVTALGTAGSSSSTNESAATTLGGSNGSSGGSGSTGGGASSNPDDPNNDSDQEGLSNQEEMVDGTDPMNSDSDGDGVADGDDALPNDPDFTFKVAPLAFYQVVDLGDMTPTALNNKGQVVGSDSSGDAVLWSKKQTYSVPHADRPPSGYGDVTDAGTLPVGISDDGLVVSNQLYDDGFETVGAGFTTSFNATAGTFTQTSLLNSLVSSGDPYEAGASTVSHNGNILGLGFCDFVTQVYTDKDGKKTDFHEIRGTACAWMAPGFSPVRVPNLPDGNDTTLSFPNLPDRVYTNSAGWDDHVDNVWAITNAGTIITQTEENSSSDSPYNLYHGNYGSGYVRHGLLATSPTATPTDFGTEIFPHAVDDKLQLAVGFSFQQGPTNKKPIIWWKKDGTWSKKVLPISNNDGVSYYYPIKINDIGQVLLDNGSLLWQNGRVEDVNKLNLASSKYQVYRLSDINDFGMMVGSATYQQTDAQGNPQGDPQSRGVLLIPIQFVGVNGRGLRNIPVVDRSFFGSLVDGIGTPEDTSGNVPPSGNGPYGFNPGSSASTAYTPPSIPNRYKFKVRMPKSIGDPASTQFTLRGIDAEGNAIEVAQLDMDSTADGYYLSRKTVVAVDGGPVDASVKAAFPDYVFVDPPRFKLEKNGTESTVALGDKATAMVFPAIRWTTNGTFGALTDAYTNDPAPGAIHPEPSPGATAFEPDQQIELFAVVRFYDASQKKLRYFCGAPDKPDTISVVEERKPNNRKTVTLESLAQAPPELDTRGAVNWWKVNQVPPDPGTSRENHWGQQHPWEVLQYNDNVMTTAGGAWKIVVGGDANKGTNRYKVSFGSVESPGALFRQNTQDDHRISDVVMRVIVKGNYPNEFLKWVSTYINVPFIDGSAATQVRNYVAIDCCDTAIQAFSRTTGRAFVDINANQLVVNSLNGTYTSVLAPVEVYPETDTNPDHLKWSQIDRPQPGDLIMFDWPNAPTGEDQRPASQRIFDHTTMFVGPTTGGKLARGDRTMYAGSSTGYCVNEVGYDESCWTAIQNNGVTTRPVRVAIVRLK